jgi:hypothetical protein
VLRPTFTDRIALLYSSNASSFVSLLSVDVSFSLADDFTVADIPLVDRTPAFSRDDRMLATLAGGLGMGVLLITFAAEDAALSSWG